MGATVKSAEVEEMEAVAARYSRNTTGSRLSKVQQMRSWQQNSKAQHSGGGVGSRRSSSRWETRGEGRGRSGRRAGTTTTRLAEAGKAAVWWPGRD